MGGLGTRLIEVRCLRRCAARCRDTVERAGELRGKDNGAIFAPISSASAVGVADHYGRTTPHRNLLQFPFAEKTDPLAVRGKKRAGPRPRAVEQHGSDFVQFTHVKLPPARYALPCDVRHSRPIGRNGYAWTVVQIELLVRRYPQREFHRISRGKLRCVPPRKQGEQQCDAERRSQTPWRDSPPQWHVSRQRFHATAGLPHGPLAGRISRRSRTR